LLIHFNNFGIPSVLLVASERVIPIYFELIFKHSEMKVSRNGPERRSGKRIIVGTVFRLEFLVGWYYDADATMAVRELF